MARQLSDAEMALASQLFSLADAVSKASQIMVVKKQEFTAAQSARTHRRSRLSKSAGGDGVVHEAQHRPNELVRPATAPKMTLHDPGNAERHRGRSLQKFGLSGSCKVI